MDEELETLMPQNNIYIKIGVEGKTDSITLITPAQAIAIGALLAAAEFTTLAFMLKRAAEATKVAPPVDRTAIQLTNGQPVPVDGSHRTLRPSGQQQGYIVLSPAERAKGFVRPVRTSYLHVGPPGPEHELRNLNAEELAQGLDQRYGYVKCEEYPPTPQRSGSVVGRYWTQEDLVAVGRGCQTQTSMGLDIAETYARDPKFYTHTFCANCKQHLPVNEFVWDDSDERVGS